MSESTQSAHSLINFTNWVLVSISSVSIKDWVAEDIFANTESILECIKTTGFCIGFGLLAQLDDKERKTGFLFCNLLEFDDMAIGFASLSWTLVTSTVSSTTGKCKQTVDLT